MEGTGAGTGGGVEVSTSGVGVSSDSGAVLTSSLISRATGVGAGVAGAAAALGLGVAGASALAGAEVLGRASGAVSGGALPCPTAAGAAEAVPPAGEGGTSFGGT